MRIRVLPQALILGAAAGVLLAAAGCHVHVDKGQNDEDKNVRIDTPLGGLHVRSDDTTAADLGLPIYPGAQVAPDKDGDKSADIHMGFGKFQLRVKVVTYRTPDDRSRVLTFYKNAMGRFGEVLECQGRQAVGTPTVTSEGLTCSDEHNGNVHVNDMPDDSGLTLRAGSRHHQHLVAFKDAGTGTRFSLVEVQIPESLTEGRSGTSD